MATSRLIGDIATALIQTAHEEKCVPEVMAHLALVRDVFYLQPELEAQLNERSVEVKLRAQALTAALNGSIHPFLINALLSLQQANILDQFADFIRATISAAHQIAGHQEVKVRSAFPLGDADRQQLLAVIEEKFGGTQRLDEKVDTALLGGLIVEVGDWYIDASLKGKLERLHHALYV